MENIRDWCISRQLWWGHRIPAYYCRECGQTVVARAAPECCPKCHGTAFRQDEDVLDTWFSSWLWPFSVFNWPEATPELRRFYPTDTLVTGPDIIFFWVARMIMAGLEFMGDVPFRDVYFTSIIRDDSGRKMSKSLNNSPDPIDVVNTYGADALRFTIIYIAPVGQDIRYSNEKCEIGRNFANKIWNAVRFRLRQGPLSPDWETLAGLRASGLRPDDRWILARLNAAVRATTRGLERFRFNDVARTLYEFIWNEFCDWYLESAKAVFNSDDAAQKAGTLRVFDHVMGTFLRLLHPIMPFVTEELYHQMGFVEPGGSIMTASWPKPFPAPTAKRLGATEETVRRAAARFELVRSVRNVRAKYLIPDGRRIDVVIVPTDAATGTFLAEDTVSLQSLLYASAIDIRADGQPEGPCGVAVSDLGTAYVPLAGVIDLEAERTRLRKQQDETTGFLASCQRKLANESFVNKAPKEVVERERARLAELEERLGRVREQLASLS
jgi:valyl-tRNA synthetase